MTEAEHTALREAARTIRGLKREIGLTHERLDELDEDKPLCDWLPELVDEAYRANRALRTERDRLQAAYDRLHDDAIPGRCEICS